MHSCSRCLQRVLSDFGLEHSFRQGAERVREHYGFEISKSAVANETLKHARAIRKMQDSRKFTGALPAHGAESITVEADGTMLRIVSTSPAADRRHTRKVEYRETRLCAARGKGQTRIVYEAGLRDVEQTGRLLGLAARQSGWALESHIHAVGDGAEWIRAQVGRVFGSDCPYLIDFFHLCEYLHAASEKLGGGQKRWMSLQKKRLKNGRSEKVILELKELLEGAAVKDEEAPARAAYRYMTNHRDCFHYKEALAADLEIGSGLIESGNKHVLQARLKIPGASWAADSADAISQARAFRANNNWCSYWNLSVA